MLETLPLGKCSVIPRCTHAGCIHHRDHLSGTSSRPTAYTYLQSFQEILRAPRRFYEFHQEQLLAAFHPLTEKQTPVRFARRSHRQLPLPPGALPRTEAQPPPYTPNPELPLPPQPQHRCVLGAAGGTLPPRHPLTPSPPLIQRPAVSRRAGKRRLTLRMRGKDRGALSSRGAWPGLGGAGGTI